jgi:hypothetical protein
MYLVSLFLHLLSLRAQRRNLVPLEIRLVEIASSLRSSQ